MGAFFSFWGYLPSFCRRHTQSYFSSWVYRLLSVSLYPHFSFVVGICLIFVAAIPNHVLFFGYIAYFPLCYTQSSIFSWV